MIKNLIQRIGGIILWFIAFGLNKVVVVLLNIKNDGLAFFVLSTVIYSIFTICNYLYYREKGDRNYMDRSRDILFESIIYLIIAISLTCLISYVAKMDFFVTFQVVTLAFVGFMGINNNSLKIHKS